ncbi:MAG TPA: PQQ-dependent dehydrogenase, methanol/ethanol family [Bryobacteraceae bacterium]|jgi:quinohemoprotein ethanol dehydrogenase|nr:PQQ-dependent dehydrogenase, methanol/ethanol family [Bryobacteraceae bacterium]
MPGLKSHRIAAGALAALALTTIVAAQQTTRSAAKPASVDASVLKNVNTAKDALSGDWLSYGRTQSETRYSPLNLINTSNVSRLGLSWTYTLGAGGGNQEGTPLVWNNTLYGITNWSVVFALDARTGKEIWRWDPEVNQAAVRPKLCCGIVQRGIALYNGRIYAPVIDGRLDALDALTGKPVWETRLGYPQDWYSITMAPRIANGKVVLGMAGGDHPTRGHFDAYDAETGKHAWRFWTVPGNPALPYENEAMAKAAKTWGGDFYKMGGGGSVWDGMAYDPETDLIFVGTGNAEPWVQKFRGAKNMDNLYTCSILAVNVTTGKLAWYYQEVPNDNWDFDAVQQLMLADIMVNGQRRKVVMQAAKDGFFYEIDRVTGKFIRAEPFTQVNWAKGFDEAGRPMINPEAFYDKEPVTIYPTAGGAHNWSPMSFNPATGLVYIPATYATWTFQAGDEVLPAQTGHTGLTRGLPQPRPNSMKIWGPDPLGNNRGVLEAWDPVTNKLAWRTPGGGGIGGGTVTTAGNLVFQVLGDGHLLAYSADKGDKLLEIATPRNGTGPPITYAIDGKQYVAFAGGAGRRPDIVGPTDAKVDGAPLLFVFELDGKAEMPAAPPRPVGVGGRGGPPSAAPPAPAAPPHADNN